MGIRDWLATRLLKSSAIQKILVQGMGEAVWSGKDYANYAKEAYLKNVIAYACVEKIARAVSSVEWYLIQTKNGEEAEVEQHPVLDLIRRPNPDESFSALMLRASAYLVFSGNAYFERIAPSAGLNQGTPRELYSHRPDRMNIDVDPNTGRRTGYTYTVNGRKHTWPVDLITGRSDILHVKTFHPTDDWYGGTPTESTAREIDTSNEATDWQKRTFQNQCRPGMIFTFKQQLSKPQFDALDNRLKERSGSAGAGKSLILEGEGADAKPYGFSPQEMDFIETNRELARRICLGYGVPPMLLGIPGDNTYSNYKEARLAFWEDTVLFYVNLMAAGLSGWLFRPEDRITMTPDLDAVPALEPRRQETWDKAKGADWLTVDEKRALTGYDALPDGKGDVVLVSATMLPLGEDVTLGQVGDGAGGTGMGDETAGKPKKPKKPADEEGDPDMMDEGE